MKINKLILQSISMGIVASLFFALTFVLNRVMDTAGGHRIWSSSLRFFFMTPFLLIIVYRRWWLKTLISHIKDNLTQRVVRSFVGFVLFYTFLCIAAMYGPAWLVASTRQITIVMWSLLIPLIYTTSMRDIPLWWLCISWVILIGIAVMQRDNASTIAWKDIFISLSAIIIAASAYPLWNRKMMDLCGDSLDTYQRVLGMTLVTLPFRILFSIYGIFFIGYPSTGQIGQSFIVALGSWVIATLLFFEATNLVKKNLPDLAKVEATQSGEVIFSRLGEVYLLWWPAPNVSSLIGMLVVVLWMLLHSFWSFYQKKT